MNNKALFKISYGVYVVTSKKGDRINGQIANTIFQVAAEPPTPYNIDGVVPGGRIGYQPYSVPWQPGALLPELPPIWEPVMGPFFLPVPVP